MKKIKQQSEKARTEEKWRLSAVSRDVENQGSFTLNLNLKRVPKFNEDDPDIVSALFERIADFQDWSEGNYSV